MALTYSQLNQAIQDYTENEEASFLANIPNFVQLAEETIYRNANLPLQSNDYTGVTVAGANTVALPSDFLAFDYLYVVDTSGAYNLLLNKELDYIYQAFPIPTFQQIPLYYGLKDNSNFVLGPTPDQVYNLKGRYLYAPASIVTSGTSWLGNNAENALLYGSLVNAYVYMKGYDAPAMAAYEKAFQEALGKVKELGEGYERSDQYRNPMPRPIDLSGGS